MDTNPQNHDWKRAHTVRYYRSPNEQPVGKSTSLTYGTVFIADFRLLEKPRRIRGWKDDYMVKARVVTEHGEAVRHLGCDADGVPTRIVHGNATNKAF